MSHKIIKEGTKKLHASLDQSSFLKNSMSKEVNNDDYLKFLCFHKAINQLMKDDLEETYQKFNFPIVNRLELVENDIDKFCQNRRLSRKTTPLDFILKDDLKPCIGVVYVVEGARHGNKYILQHLLKYLTLTTDECSFLSHESRIEWKRITDLLNALKKEEVDFNLKQARKTFHLLIDISNHLNEKMNEEYTI